MPDTDQQKEQAEAARPARQPRKKAFLMVGLAAALGLAGGAGTVFSGVLNPLLTDGPPALATSQAMADIAMLPIPPIIVPVRVAERPAKIRLTVHIETTARGAEQTKKLLPRIADVINGYLRAVDPEILAEPRSFEKTRAALLRRARLVAGEDLVRDVLIQELLIV